MADDITIQPSYAIQKNSTARVLRTNFGDGYSQRAADGLNNIATTWELVWENISVDTADSIISILEGKAGYQAITWTPKRESNALKWICTSWSRTFTSNNYDTVRATFERVFDL